MYIVTGHTGEEHVQASDDASFNGALLGMLPYVLQQGQCLAYEIISNNRIDIKDGDVVCQGHHARTPAGEAESCIIPNGTQGQIRHDIIAVRFEKGDTTTTDSAEIVVVCGTPGAVGVDPTLNNDNIANGSGTYDMPLYRVVLNGINIESVTPLFHMFPVLRRIRSGAQLPAAADSIEGDIFLLTEE